MAQIKIQKWDEVNGVTDVGEEEPLPGYDSGKNYLRTVEDSVEVNDNCLDGIINNVNPAVEDVRRQSVLQILVLTMLQLEEEEKAFSRRMERMVRVWEREKETLSCE